MKKFKIALTILFLAGAVLWAGTGTKHVVLVSRLTDVPYNFYVQYADAQASSASCVGTFSYCLASGGNSETALKLNLSIHDTGFVRDGAASSENAIPTEFSSLDADEEDGNEALVAGTAHDSKNAPSYTFFLDGGSDSDAKIVSFNLSSRGSDNAVPRGTYHDMVTFTLSCEA